MNSSSSGRMYTLTGLPYAGKTTLRNELVKKFGFSAVSADEVIDEYGMDVLTMTQDDWNTAYSEAYNRLKELLQDGKTVIVDIGNLKRSERDVARNLAESMGVKNTLIYLNTPLDEIKRRREANMETKSRGHLEDVTMDLAVSLWEEPTSNENPVLFNAEMNMDRWIEENIERESTGSIETKQ